MQNLPIVAIIGRPNVGKSTLFNRLIGFRQAIVCDIPGTTRDRIFGEVYWNGKPFILVDTAGLLTDYYGFKEKEIELISQKYVELSLMEADTVLFVVDAKSLLVAQDEQIARILRKIGKRVILVVNKADSQIQERRTDEFAELNFKEKIAVSAISGRRTGDLLDLITKNFKAYEPEKNEDLKVAIVGRPNVGKSTLFNLIAKDERAIVSDIPGTTRDSQDFKLKLDRNGKTLTVRIIDTAGFRKRGRIEMGIEKYSVMRTVDSIIKSNLVLLVIDASEGITRGDAHLAQLAIDRRKELMIILNKIDLLETKTKDEIKNLNRFIFLAKKTMVAISAKNRENIELLEREIFSALENVKEKPRIEQWKKHEPD